MSDANEYEAVTFAQDTLYAENLQRALVLMDVDKERSRQDDLWGDIQLDPVHGRKPTQWVSILTEEVGELAELCNNLELSGTMSVKRAINLANEIYEEAVQVAAVAVSIAQWAENGENFMLRQGDEDDAE